MNPLLHEDPADHAIETIAPPSPIPLQSIREGEEAGKKEREEAFQSEFSWRGERLHGFSVSRSALFLQHRVSMGAPDLQACLDDMDAFFADACRILWLCSHKPEAWTLLRCSPGALQAAIDRWTDENITGSEQSAATLLAFRIYAASTRNQHEPAPLAHRPSGDDLGN